MAPSRIDWQSSPVVFVRRLRCPVCGTDKRGIIVRTTKKHDETRRQYICRACSSPYLLIVGDDEDDDVSSF